MNHPDSFSTHAFFNLKTEFIIEIHNYRDSKAKWKTSIDFKLNLSSCHQIFSSLFSVLFRRKSMSSTFTSCSLSTLSKVISGISSSGASLSMCWFQTPAWHCRFSSCIRFMGVQTGDEAGGLLEKKTLHSGFPLLCFLLFSTVCDFYCVLPPWTMQLL